MLILWQVLAGTFVPRQAHSELPWRPRPQFDACDDAQDPTVSARNLLCIMPCTQRVYLSPFIVTVNNPHLSYAELGMTLKLFIGIIARTADLDYNIRGALKIFVLIDPKASWRQQHKVRNAVVVRPAAKRGYVNVVVHPHPQRTCPAQTQVRLHCTCQILVFPV